MSTAIVPSTGSNVAVVTGTQVATTDNSASKALDVSLALNVAVQIKVHPDAQVFPKAVAAAFLFDRALRHLQQKDALFTKAPPRVGLSRYLPPGWATACAASASGILACFFPEVSLVFFPCVAAGIVQGREAWQNRNKPETKRTIASEFVKELHEAYEHAKKEAGDDPQTHQALHTVMVGYLNELRAQDRFRGQANTLFFDALTDAPQVPVDGKLQKRVITALGILKQRAGASDTYGKRVELPFASEGEKIALDSFLSARAGGFVAVDLDKHADDAKKKFREVYEKHAKPHGEISEQHPSADTV